MLLMLVVKTQQISGLHRWKQDTFTKNSTHTGYLGNYFSNHNHADLNDDGITDLYHDLSGDGQSDAYPLAETFDANLKGDVDGNCKLDVRDAILSLQVLADKEPIDIRSDYEASEVDVNGNKKIGMQEIWVWVGPSYRADDICQKH